MKMSSLVLHKFYSYLIKNLVMLLLLCLVITPIGFIYHENEVRSTLDREQELLNSSIRRLNDELITMESLMENFCSQAQLQILSVQPTIEPKQRLTLSDLRGNLSSLCSADQLLTEIAILFDNSDTVVTSKGSFTTLSTSSGVERFLDFYNLDGTLASCFTLENNRDTNLGFLEGLCLDVPLAFGVPQEIAFVYSMKINAEVYAFLFISQEGLNQFFSPLLGCVTINGYHNQSIASIANGLTEAQVSHHVLASHAYTRVSGTLAISSGALEQVVNSTTATILMFALVLVIFSLVLAILNAYRFVQPICRVVNVLVSYGFQQKGHNEVFNYFLSCVENIRSEHQHNMLEITSLQQQLEKNIIEQYLYTPSNLLRSADDLPAVKHFPQRYVLGYATLCAQYETTQENKAQELQILTSMVAAKLSKELDAIQILLDYAGFVLIIPAESDYDQQLIRLKHMINTMSDTVSIPLSMMVSRVFVGLSELNVAFETTRAHMFDNNSIPGLHYVQSEAKDENSDLMPDTGMRCTDSVQLCNIILEGNYQRASKLIEHMITTSYEFATLEQRYYYVRMALLQVQQTLPDEAPSLPPDYSTHYSPEWLLQQLNGFAEELCQIACRQHRTENGHEVRERLTRTSNHVIQYINENFSCDALSTQSICTACGIGSRTLNDICRKATGMNVSAYIQQLRMDKAASMLRNTDIKVDDILRECGYATPNTFYKAFKRLYDKSPSEYRSSFR